MKLWSFLNNVFLSATSNSYRAMKKIGNFTVAALDAKKSDPFFNSLLTLLLPYVTTYNNAYSTWVSKLGTQMGHTASLKDLLKQLSTEKIETWDLAIQNLYRDTTAQYIALLPYHRIPFQNGSQDDRITAVEALIKAIGDDTKLKDIKKEIQDFYDQLATDYNTQKGSKSSTSNNSDAVEAARIASATMLYGILGELMSHFKATPAEVGNYFDLQTLRNIEQSVYKHDINGGETLLAVTNTFEAEEEVRLVNRGLTILHFALVKEVAENIGDTFIAVAPNSEQTIDAALLGNIATNRYLKVMNTDANLKGAYTVELV
jgi:hypothetical protein